MSESPTLLPVCDPAPQAAATPARLERGGVTALLSGLFLLGLAVGGTALAWPWLSSSVDRALDAAAASGSIARAVAEVRRQHSANAAGGDGIYILGYSFLDASQVWRLGSSMTDDVWFFQGTPQTRYEVEYLPGQPQRSRLIGARAAPPFRPRLGLGLFVLGYAGYLLCLVGLLGQRRRRRILRSGEPVEATLVAVEPLFATAGRDGRELRQWTRLLYTYAVRGRTYAGRAFAWLQATNDPGRGATFTVLVDPRSPDRHLWRRGSAAARTKAV